MSDLTTFRAEKDRYFKMSPHSPIPPDERAFTACATTPRILVCAWLYNVLRVRR